MNAWSLGIISSEPRRLPPKSPLILPSDGRNLLTSCPPEIREKGSIVQLLSIEQGRDIRLAGELDMSNEPELDEVLRAAVEKGGPTLVDLSELTFIDSTGISALLRAAVALGDRGCLILHGEQDHVHRVLDLVGVEASITNVHRIYHDPLGSSNGSERKHSQAT